MKAFIGILLLICTSMASAELVIDSQKLKRVGLVQTTTEDVRITGRITGVQTDNVFVVITTGSITIDPGTLLAPGGYLLLRAENIQISPTARLLTRQRGNDAVVSITAADMLTLEGTYISAGRVSIRGGAVNFGSDVVLAARYNLLVVGSPATGLDGVTIHCQPSRCSRFFVTE